MLVFVSADKADAALEAITLTGEDGYLIGEMVKRDDKAVIFEGLDPNNG